ncbi:hypothetical protein ACFSL4_36560 [Streptomyces caeni]|uniref:ABC transporter ATP-binding protein n=1 Tax=Streptomyces caeni TaxID=2307231 RepID=A0ABW4J1R5_9ACTN
MFRRVRGLPPGFFGRRDATEILVLDYGRVVERGTRDDLLARGAACARLHAVTVRTPAVEAVPWAARARRRLRSSPRPRGRPPSPAAKSWHLARAGWLDLYDGEPPERRGPAVAVSWSAFQKR